MEYARKVKEEIKILRDKILHMDISEECKNYNSEILSKFESYLSREDLPSIMDSEWGEKYIDQQYEKYIKTKSYRLATTRLIYLKNTPVKECHENFGGWASSSVYTNLIQSFFKNNNKILCACGEQACERCHGVYSRPDILRLACVIEWPDPSVPIELKKISKRFIMLHKLMPITLKCKKCHLLESKQIVKSHGEVCSHNKCKHKLSMKSRIKIIVKLLENKLRI